MSLSGGCECGAVTYTVADEFEYAGNCHCANCRASTGSAFKPFAGIARDKVEITGARVHVALGSLRDAPSLLPQNHMFVGSKAPWYEIRDDLPQFDRYPE